MNLTLPRSALLAGLSKVIGVIPSKSPQAILTQVRLVISDANALRIDGTNGIMSASTKVNLAQFAEDSQACLPAHRLHALIAAMRDGDINIKLTDQQAIIREVGKKKSHHVLHGLNPTDFSAILDAPKATDLTLPAEVALSLIAHTAHAIPNGTDTPSCVKGLCLEWDEQKVRAIAFSPYSLVVFDVEYGSEAPGRVLIPAPAVRELRRLCADGDVSITVHGQNVILSSGATRVSSRMLDGEFPREYHRLIPNKADGAVVSTADLRQAIGCASALADDDGGVVRIELAPGKVAISNREMSSNQASDEVDAEYAGPAVVVHCELRHIRDASAAITDDTASIEAANPKVHMVIRAGGHVQTIATRDLDKAEPPAAKEAA